MKKKIPIGSRKILDQVSSGNNGLFEAEFTEDCVIRFKDSDSESDFFFEIQKINAAQGNNIVSYTIRYKPSNEETLSPHHTSVNLSNFRGHFDKWKKLLIEANKESPLFDDVFTQSYYDELEPKFEILDEDAEIKPYSIEQQQRIVEFLDKAQKILNRQKRKNDPEIKEASELIKETKANISKSTKKKVVKNIRKIIAKGFKAGLEIGQKLLIEFTTELAKKLIMGG
ncbi:hypothetical protein P8625_04950 [Tenacibaculum tangerinum]|uniref:Uncharacterized protein n=1 Tax=Tenacibaculum tangerinum TaxID=3038772 RepID=A0ABY8L510_9FLAO|nr:hypothetical protein [Tenacibaculum tangerinum]WGH76509.1 hypothetical protein P8625_04950 [Tenacibaculum tangerinum]